MTIYPPATRTLTLIWTEKSGPQEKLHTVIRHKQVTPELQEKLSGASMAMRNLNGRDYYDALTALGIPDHDGKTFDGKPDAARQERDLLTHAPLRLEFCQHNAVRAPAPGVPPTQVFSPGGTALAAASDEQGRPLDDAALARFNATGDSRPPAP